MKNNEMTNAVETNTTNTNVSRETPAPKVAYDHSRDTVLADLAVKTLPNLGLTVGTKPSANCAHVKLGKQNIIGTCYQSKANTYTVYFSERYFQRITDAKFKNLMSQFVYHANWGMKYELRGITEESFKNIIPMIEASVKATQSKKEEPKKEAPKSEKKKGESNKK